MKQIIDHLSGLMKSELHRGYSLETQALSGGAELIYLQRFGNPAFAFRLNYLAGPEILIGPSADVETFAAKAIAFIKSQQTPSH